MKNNNDDNKWNKYIRHDPLIDLSINSIKNSMGEKALKELKRINSCDSYATYIVEIEDMNTLHSLAINTIFKPNFDDR